MPFLSEEYESILSEGGSFEFIVYVLDVDRKTTHCRVICIREIEDTLVRRRVLFDPLLGMWFFTLTSDSVHTPAHYLTNVPPIAFEALRGVLLR